VLSFDTTVPGGNVESLHHITQVYGGRVRKGGQELQGRGWGGLPATGE
jgi:hypothetical protein